MLPKIYFMIKEGFFQKNQLGIGVWWRKVAGNWSKIGF
jgi:hypothetical protein